MNKEEHDQNLQRFYDIIKQYELTLNPEKSIIAVEEIKMLGYLISYRCIKPDPERMTLQSKATDKNPRLEQFCAK